MSTEGLKPKVIATVEARMASTRLPGKTMFPLMGQPVLYRVVERIRPPRSLNWRPGSHVRWAGW